ncbi:efflux RND transporter periplasmic adaptor subunit [soil metagenome]
MFTKIKQYLTILILAFLSACGNPGEQPKVLPATTKTVNVEVVKPVSRNINAEIHITGNARPNQSVILHAMESGFVKRLHKDIGDPVRKGELIAELENPEISRQYQRLNAQVNAKKSNYDRLKSVYEKTPALTPLQMVEQAEAEYLMAKAELDATADRLGFLKVKAPFNGIISKRFVDHGVLIQNGITIDNAKPVFEVLEISPIRLTIPLPESDIAVVKEGMPVEISFPELAGASFTANISRTSKALDPLSKTMQLEIDIENSSETIKPGMYAKVIMKVSSRANVLTLPLPAQSIYQDEYFVMAVRDNIVERIKVRKGLSDKDYFEVLNPEIGAETLVIIQGKGLVKEGQVVNPILMNHE